MIEARREPPALLAQAYVQRAEARFTDMAQWCPVAMPDLDQAVRLAPLVVRIRFHRASCLGMAGRLDDALRELDPSLPYTPVAKRWMIFHARGDVFMRGARADEAIDAYDEAIRLAPEVAVNYRDRALIWLGSRHFDRALDDVDRAISLYPKDALSYAIRASIRQARGEEDLAKQDMLRARQLSPGLGN